MAIDLAAKKANWVSRLITAAVAAMDAVNKAALTATEYSTDAYNGGDLTNRAAYQITDADLAGVAPQLDAAKLNALVGGIDALKSAYDSNAGILEAARP